MPSDYCDCVSGLNDFNNTILTIVFEPDEIDDENEQNAPIPIINDELNEATEQAFVVQLRLIDSVDPSSVILEQRPASLCRIVDDDSK